MAAAAAQVRDGIYASLRDARRDLLDAIDGIPDDQMTVPLFGDWSAKDILAHIASWEEQIIPDLLRVRQRLQPALASFREAEVDQWNALLMSLRRTFPLKQVTDELHYYRRALLEALNSLPDEALAAGFVPSTCAICAYHDRDHAGQIRQWRQREGV